MIELFFEKNQQKIIFAFNKTYILLFRKHLKCLNNKNASFQNKILNFDIIEKLNDF